ncbi:hypothetical protein PCE1_003541 [Barthelona sp. PCE]
MSTKYHQNRKTTTKRRKKRREPPVLSINLDRGVRTVSVSRDTAKTRNLRRALHKKPKITAERSDKEIFLNVASTSDSMRQQLAVMQTRIDALESSHSKLRDSVTESQEELLDRIFESLKPVFDGFQDSLVLMANRIDTLTQLKDEEPEPRSAKLLPQHEIGENSPVSVSSVASSQPQSITIPEMDSDIELDLDIDQDSNRLSPSVQSDRESEPHRLMILKNQPQTMRAIRSTSSPLLTPSTSIDASSKTSDIEQFNKYDDVVITHSSTHTASIRHKEFSSHLPPIPLPFTATPQKLLTPPKAENIVLKNTPTLPNYPLPLFETVESGGFCGLCRKRGPTISNPLQERGRRE